MPNQSRNNLSDTIPEVPVAGGMSSDTLPDQANVYVPPRPLAQSSDHRTIQIKPVLLADHVDPRRAQTELRLSAPAPLPFRKEPAPWLLASSVVVVAVGSIAAAAWFGGWLPGLSTPSAAHPAAPVSLKGEDIPVGPISRLPAPEPVRAPAPTAMPPAAESDSAELESEALSREPVTPLAPGAASRQNAGRVRKKAPDPWLE